MVAGMTASQIVAPSDHRILADAWFTMSAAARLALANFCQHGAPLGMSVSEELHAAGLVVASGAVWIASDRGLAMCGMALGADVMP